MSSSIRGKDVPISAVSRLLGLLVLLAVTVIYSGDSVAESETDQLRASGYIATPSPQPGDPYSTIIIRLNGDVALEKGFHGIGEPAEVMRLTHEGFIVVGEHKIHIDTLATVIERLAIVQGKAVTE